MVSPINSLTNMEYMLYGGASGVNPNCPSFSNGYMANRNSWNYQMPFGYNNQSIWNNQYGQNYGYGNVGGASATTSNTQQASQTGFWRFCKRYGYTWQILFKRYGTERIFVRCSRWWCSICIG